LSKAKKAATYEERKAKALSEGTRVEYISCPLCGRNRPLIVWDEETRFEVKPNYAIVQVRYGGGRGIGFFLNEEESIYLQSMREQYPELLDNLKEEIAKLYELFKNL